MRIILITPNNEEWEEWKKWAEGKNNVKLESNSLETTINNYQLYVLHTDLGSLPSFNPNDENFKTEAQQFLKNLYEVIKDYNDKDTAIGIHISGRESKDNKGFLLNWINCLKSQLDEIQKLSENFIIVTEPAQEYDKPTISFYTTRGAPDQFIKEYATPKGITVLYHRILRNRPPDPELEEKLKQKWKKWEKEF
jgi:cobalamin biosynthesis Mg chelatase CobN